MTPSELKAIRKKLNMTQKELGAILGVCDREIKRYEAGVVPIPMLTEKFLEMYINYRPSCDDQ